MVPFMNDFKHQQQQEVTIMFNLERQYYSEQADNLTLGQKRDILELYATEIGGSTDWFDLECLVYGRTPEDAVRFMYENGLTPYSEYYWENGRLKEGTLYDYIEDVWEDDYLIKLIDTLGIDDVNNNLQDGYIESFEEEEEEEEE